MKFKRMMSAFLAFAMIIGMISLTDSSDVCAASVSNVTFRVTFDLNGGTGALDPSVVLVNEGGRLPHVNTTTISRNNHVFGGWGTTESCVELWDMNHVVTADMTLYAWWRPLHAITFNLGHIRENQLMPGTEAPAINVTTHRNQVVHGMTVPQPTPAPRAMGFLFDGWFADTEFLIPFNWNMLVTEPQTLFARWRSANNVEFNLNYQTYPLIGNEEALDNPVTLQLLDNAIVSPQPTAPNRQAVGLVFAGWFTVQDRLEDGSVPEVARWDFGVDRVQPETHLTLYAHFEQAVNISFDSNFEGATIHPPAQIRRPGEPIHHAAPQQRPNTAECRTAAAGNECSQGCRAGAALTGHGNEWSFEGWYRNPAGTGQKWEMSGTEATLVGTSDVTLYAKWVPSYVVTYVLNPRSFTDLDVTNMSAFAEFRYVTIPLSGNPHVSLPALTATRHIFETGGWYKEQSLQNQWTHTDIIDRDITLFANWIPAWVVTYDQNHNPDEETVDGQLQRRLVPQGGTGREIVQHLTIMHRTGYDFVDWFPNKRATGTPWNIDAVINSDITIFAGWAQRATVEFLIPEGYSLFANSPLRFNPAESRRIHFQELSIGTNATNPVNENNKNSIIDGFTIVGWCFHADNCTRANCNWDFARTIEITHEPNIMRLYANVVSAIQVSFDLNWPGERAGERYFAFHDGSIMVVQLQPGDPLTLTTAHNPTGTNIPTGTPPYQFSGWFTSASGANEINEARRFSNGTILESDTILYAGWNNAFTVTFDANLPSGVTAEVDVPSMQHILPGERAINPNPAGDRPPQLAGYEFKGWFTNAACTPGNEFDFNTPVTQNVILYANWARTVTITFNLNYAGGRNPPDVVVAVGDLVTNPERPVRPGYELTGWYTSRAAADANDENRRWDLDRDSVTAQMTLFAGWVEVFEVSFDLNFTTDDIPPATNTVIDGEFAIRPTPPVRRGYTFVGWYTRSDINVETMVPWIFHEDSVTENMVLYAGWVYGTLVNPLMSSLDEIMAAAERNSGQSIYIEMGNFSDLPRAIIRVIQGRDINLDLDFGGYMLHISGLGIATVADKNWNLEVEISYDTRILGIPMRAIEEFAAGRPVWQIIISEDVDSIVSGITIVPNDIYSGQYAILMSRVGDEFEARRQVRIPGTGNVMLDLSLGASLGNGEFIILISETPDSGVFVDGMCQGCDWPTGNCRCACPVCNEQQRNCVCRDCEYCGRPSTVCICCIDCGRFEDCDCNLICATCLQSYPLHCTCRILICGECMRDFPNGCVCVPELFCTNCYEDELDCVCSNQRLVCVKCRDEQCSCIPVLFCAGCMNLIGDCTCEKNLLCADCDNSIENCDCRDCNECGFHLCICCTSCGKLICDCNLICGDCRQPIGLCSCRPIICGRCGLIYPGSCTCTAPPLLFCGICMNELENCTCPKNILCGTCNRSTDDCTCRCTTCNRNTGECICCPFCEQVICECSEPCEVCGQRNCSCVAYNKGNVWGNGIVSINDALEILKFLAGLDNILVENPLSMTAALITPESVTVKEPTINDVLEILKLLAGLPSLI
jgi:uncharacterized repeat protein (TIGR02543 family)